MHSFIRSDLTIYTRARSQVKHTHRKLTTIVFQQQSLHLESKQIATRNSRMLRWSLRDLVTYERAHAPRPIQAPQFRPSSQLFDRYKYPKCPTPFLDPRSCYMWFTLCSCLNEKEKKATRPWTPLPLRKFHRAFRNLFYIKNKSYYFAGHQRFVLIKTSETSPLKKF